jgi:hypothetical protein
MMQAIHNTILARHSKFLFIQYNLSLLVNGVGYRLLNTVKQPVTA